MRWSPSIWCFKQECSNKNHLWTLCKQVCAVQTHTRTHARTHPGGLLVLERTDRWSAMRCRVFICSTGWPAACGITTVPLIWKRLEWCGWVSVHLCISARSVYPPACVFMCAWWTQRKAKWKEITVIGVDAARCTHAELSEKIKDTDTGLDLIVSFL